MSKCKCASLIFLLIIIPGISSCHHTNQTSIEQSPALEIVSSTPPFPTKEPDHYRAVRTVTRIDPGGQSTATRTLISRDGPFRREEIDGGGPEKLVYLERSGQRYLILPDRKLYAEIDAQFTIPGSVENDPADSSPDRLLHVESVQTIYQKLANEILDGRSVSKYKVTVNAPGGGSVSNTVTMIWVDEKLGMPVKSETSTNNGARVTMELSSISEAVNKTDFDIPAGYQKVTAVQLLARTKHSE